MDWLAEYYNISMVDDWYNISQTMFYETGGGGLLTEFYDSSPSKALKCNYPDTKWQPWRFERMPHRYWDVVGNQFNFMEWFQDRNKLPSIKNWQGITKQMIESNRGGSLLNKCGSLISLLRNHYPEEEWQAYKWTLNSVSVTQSRLLEILNMLIPKDVEIECESAIPAMKYKHTQKPMYFDVWIPMYNLAVEYNGIQHYMEHGFVHTHEGLFRQSKRDKEKITQCKIFDITILSIPFWWQNEVEVVAQMLKEVNTLMLIISNISSSTSSQIFMANSLGILLSLPFCIQYDSKNKSTRKGNIFSIDIYYTTSCQSKLSQTVQ
jgi:hypothetical protein